MSRQLINRSPDLKRLRDSGYQIEVKGGYLLVHRIPYINGNKEVKYGSLVSQLVLSGQTTASPSTHVVYFAGEHPCNTDGSIIQAIRHQSLIQALHEDITVHHSFSNKPKGSNGYPNYFEKIKRYADIISAPAKSLDDRVTERPFLPEIDNEPDSVFQYFDTNSSRANINIINAKLKNQRVAIIGMGGTGAYILDMLAKTPVEQIHLYDGDEYLTHNAFRSPGAASLELLEERPKKVDYYKCIYSNMHKNVIAHSYYLSSENWGEIDQMDYVFICIDNNGFRRELISYLLKINTQFIDVGLGVNTVGDSLIGMIRVTTGTPQKNDHLAVRIPGNDNENNEYVTNIQIAELNALNAVKAVIKWKKLCGFYQDLENEHHSTYSINVAQLLNEDFAT